jgi:ABC-type Mn2+/Zn2+ transport system permease subunit
LFAPAFLVMTISYGRLTAELTRSDSKKQRWYSTVLIVVGQILLSMGIAHAGLSQSNALVFAARGYRPGAQPWPWNTIAGGAWIFCIGSAICLVLAAYLRTDWNNKKLALFGLIHAFAFAFAVALVTAAYNLGMPFSA